MVVVFLEAHFDTRCLRSGHGLLVKVLLPRDLAGLRVLLADEEHLRFAKFDEVLVHGFEDLIECLLLLCLFYALLEVLDENLHVYLHIDVLELPLVHHGV